MDLWKAVAAAVAVLAALVVAAQPLYVLGLTLLDYGHTPAGPYYTEQTKDATRFPADDPGRLSALTAHAAAPPGTEPRPDAVVRVPTDDWRVALAASRLRAAADAVLVFGDAPAPGNASAVTLPDDSPAEAAAAIATRGAGTDDVSPDNVVVVSSEHPRWALPAAAWSAYSGDPVLYASSDGVPEATRDAIADLDAAHAYVLAPADAVSDAALSELPVPWTRVAGRTPGDHAVEVAKFRDEARDFGWGIDERDKVGYYNFLLVNPGRWDHAVAAANLQRGKAGPLLLTRPDGSLPAITENYAWRHQPGWFATPAEGPYDHVFVLGTVEEMSWVAQTRMDYAVEINPYRLHGPGLSALEVLVTVWAAVGLLGGAFVFAHARRRIPEMQFWTGLVWPLVTLLLGPVGAALYWTAYRGREVVDTDRGRRVVRPYWLQAAVATAMGVSFAATAMIAVAFLLTYVGMPLVVFESPVFALGSSMVLLILLVYATAFLVSWLVFHVPMFRDAFDLDVEAAARRGALAVAVSMTSVSVGMMGGMWWIMMRNLPMMPGEDDVLWFGVMTFATLVGFAVAWPVNGWLVRENVKPGGVL